MTLSHLENTSGLIGGIRALFQDWLSIHATPRLPIKSIMSTSLDFRMGFYYSFDPNSGPGAQKILINKTTRGNVMTDEELRALSKADPERWAKEAAKRLSPEVKAAVRAIACFIKSDVLARIEALEKKVSSMASASRVAEIEDRIRAELANLRRLKGAGYERTN
jgi:hypothetical protein